MSASEQMLAGQSATSHLRRLELTSKLGHDAKRMSSVQRLKTISTPLTLRLLKDKKQRRNSNLAKCAQKNIKLGGRFTAGDAMLLGINAP